MKTTRWFRFDFAVNRRPSSNMKHNSEIRLTVGPRIAALTRLSRPACRAEHFFTTGKESGQADLGAMANMPDT
jgi:hypothetical protein